MAFALNNVSTADAYPTPPAGASLQCVGTERINVIIANAAVFVEYTFRDIEGTITVGPDTFLPPGMYSFNKSINLVRFKAGVAGIQARVTAEALLGKEV